MRILFVLFITLIYNIIFAQSVGIGTTMPDSSAILDLTSDSLGVLVPRMDSIKRMEIESPSEGLLVYQTNGNKGFYYHNGTIWQKVGGDGNEWTKKGANELFTTKAIGIGNSDPNDYAMLDITSTEKGILIPRMTEMQRDAISDPEGGLIIYQNGPNKGLYHFDGSDDTWKKVGDGPFSWTDGSGTVFTNDRVGIGTVAPDNSAILDLSSTDKGFLLPRMTTTQRDAISAPTQGLKIFNTDDRCEDTYDGNKWAKKCDMKLIGNSTSQPEFWRPRTDFPDNGRYGMISFVLNGKAYVGLGNAGLSTKRDIWQYKPESNTWIQKNDFGGSPRSSAVAFVLNDKAYVGLGLEGNTYKSDFWEYDPTLDSWTQVTDFGGSARYGSIAFVANNKGYVCLGFDGSLKKDLWEYSPSVSGGSWAQKTSFPGTARYGASAFVISNKGYVGLGYDGNFSNDFYEYTPSTTGGNGSWALKAVFPGVPRERSNTFSFSTIGFVVNGNSNGGVDLNDFWQYTPSSNSWEQKYNFSGVPREDAFSFVINNKGYIGCGFTNSGFIKDLWEFNLSPLSGKEYKEDVPHDALIFKGHDWTSSGNELYTTLENVNATVRGSLILDGKLRTTNSYASGILSSALGNGSAYGDYSVSLNSGNARGYSSLAVNGAYSSNGSYSTASGYGTFANGYSSFVCGMYNDSLIARQISYTDITDDTPLFIIGNSIYENARSNAMVVRKNGNTTIGGNGGDAKLQVVNGDEVSLTTNGYVMLGSENGANLIMDKNEIQGRDNGSSANIYLQNEGSFVIIGDGVPENKLTVYGNAYKSSGGTSWVNSSDKRLKEDVSSFKDGLTEILKIDPIWYRYTKESGCDYSQKYVGVIAQELQKISPYMVSESKKLAPDGTPYLQVDNSAMTYMLINAVKELAKQNEELKMENETLKVKSENDYNTLKAELDIIKQHMIPSSFTKK